MRKALLRQSLVNFKLRGFTMARTRPDANNPDNVFALLQRLGFRIEYTRLWYKKVLRDEKEEADE
ncbi:unnamed protein product [marine sediment metagenome]|uniref:Uncharacterized protein n=1 Tax=marine sediment metagenome TaxID=412755 RepID=X1UGR9_9ZZZZ